MSERQSFYVGVKAIIAVDGGVLMLKDQARDTWEFPGGRIDVGQSIEESLARELEEEISGSELISLGKVIDAAIGDFTVEDEHKLCLVFYAPTVKLSPTIELSNEHTDQAVVTEKNYRDYNMFSTDQAALEKFFAQQRAGKAS